MLCDAMSFGCYRHPATCPCSHFSFLSRRMWYCFRRVLYSRIKSLTSPSSPSRKLVARVSESNSDSVVSVSSLEYNAGGENGYNQFQAGRAVNTFKAWSISACFACHCFSSSFASKSFSSAALRACRTSSCRERIRSGGLVGSKEDRGCACNGTICGPRFSQSLEIVLCLRMCRLIQGCQ